MKSAADTRLWLWTWSGESFGYRDGDDLWTHNGRHVGRFDGDIIYGPDGSYLGELLDNDRLIIARFRISMRRAGFAAQPHRAKSLPRKRVPGYRIPTGHQDFPPQVRPR